MTFYNELPLPFVSIIIPTYHDWNRLQICLDALKNQTYPQSCFEIIIVNNNPSDKPPTTLTMASNFKFLEESLPGSYAARNKALAIAKGSIYAFTDSDCQPEADWLAVAVDFFKSNPQYDRIGGNIQMIIKDEIPTWPEIYEKAFAFQQSEFVKRQGMAATGNMIAKKIVFDAIGVFDQRLMSGGDAEWGIRANNNGFRIAYVDQCIVWHPTRDKLADIIQKTKREAGGHLQLQQRKGLLFVYLSILAGILPPLKSGYKLLKNTELPNKEKTIAFLIRYYLRLITLWEKTLITFGKKAERI